MSVLQECELRFCVNNNLRRAVVRVNENIGDMSYTTWICQQCANKLGMKNGADLPDASTVEKILKGQS